jgi:hypothetical protein
MGSKKNLGQARLYFFKVLPGEWLEAFRLQQVSKAKGERSLATQTKVSQNPPFALLILYP